MENEHFEPYIFRDKGKRGGHGLLYKKMGFGPVGESTTATVKATA